jgi:hypothetical protein
VPSQPTSTEVTGDAMRTTPRNAVGGVRRQARDSLSAAAVSFAGSVAMTALIWAFLRWLG